MTSDFERFLKSNGPAIDCKEADKAVIRKYESRLPGSLLQFWREAGWCGYRKGLIYFVNPAEYKDLLADWRVPKGSIVFARTGFGDLILWAKGEVQVLFVQYGQLAKMSRIDLFLNISLTSKDFVENGLLGREYKMALKRLGPPGPDECYGFVPALALGGSGKPETIQKVKCREYLAILAQLVD
ncbi:MAG: GAD-like domain-containing protein [Polyangiales bacterium]